ncbi:MAG: alpha/beta hydrolase, partial [Clostridia bacterium]|nr:alpha/beta hydrolase [Clostridia bacterium]
MEMQSAGVKIHYELAGNGARRVVLLHGWGCSTKLMKPIADFLAKDMTVLSVDFPAHGESGRPPEPWGVPEFAACLKELLQELRFLPCSVIAHSFGG